MLRSLFPPTEPGNSWQRLRNHAGEPLAIAIMVGSIVLPPTTALFFWDNRLASWVLFLLAGTCVGVLLAASLARLGETLCCLLLASAVLLSVGDALFFGRSATASLAIAWLIGICLGLVTASCWWYRLMPHDLFNGPEVK